MCAFRRDTNLRDQLVSSKLGPSPAPGTFPCGRRRCRNCAHVLQVDTLVGPKGQHRISDHFSCTTPNVVYAIVCRLCKHIYVGQTSQIMGNRMAQHLRSIRDRENKPVARHFNSVGHSLPDLTFTGLIACKSDEKERRALEIRMISKLGSVVPTGMNTRTDLQLF